MNNINWKAKLTSRKLWVSLAGLIVGVLLLFGASQGLTQQISGVIMSLGSVVAYIIGEGLVDAASAGSTLTVPDYTGQPIGTVPDTAAADADSTGAAQAAEVKRSTADTAK